jgi:hypothetical protein
MGTPHPRKRNPTTSQSTVTWTKPPHALYVVAFRHS